MDEKKRYPFKFLDAYEKKDKDIFFGRDQEIDTLYQMAFQTNLMLVYGASGTGKTSLIRCGLANRFESSQWMGLYIRKGEDINNSLLKAIKQNTPSLVNAGSAETEMDWFEKLMKIEETSTANSPVSDLNESGDPIGQALKDLYLANFTPIYLIFDQFEELYILGDKPEQEQFIKTVKDILRLKLPVKIIIAIREEYLGYLYEFERAVPELLTEKIRVEAVDLGKVKTILNGINNYTKSKVHLKKGEEEAIAESIFEKIRGNEKTLTIQLPYLQVFLDKFYMKVSKNDKQRNAEVVFTLSDLETMGDLENVLGDFLDDKVTEATNQPGQEQKIIWTILSRFVSAEGTKEPTSKKVLFEQLKTIDKSVIKEALDFFTKSRILRFSKKEERYEVSHDLLAKHIYKNLSAEELERRKALRLIKYADDDARQPYNPTSLELIDRYSDQFTLTEDQQDWINKSREIIIAQEAAKHTEEIKRIEEEAQLRVTKSRLRWVGMSLVLVMLLLSVAIVFWRKSEVAKIAMEEEQAKNERIIDAFYYYDDRFALSYKDRLYYFVDKNGDKVTKLGQWNNALQFDWTGYAIVKKMDKYLSLNPYFLDTIGHVYPISYVIPDIKSETKAFVLSEGYSEKIDPVVFEYKDLEILKFDWNLLDSLPGEITNLTELSYMDLSRNLFEHFPIQVSQMKNLRILDLKNNIIKEPSEIIAQLDLAHLTSLDLTGNPISKEELEKIRKSLPDCNVIFNIDYAKEANKYFNLGEYIEAYEAQTKAIENNKNDDNLLFNLSYYALFVNKPLEAIIAAKQILELNPTATGVEANLALGYLLSNQWPEAEEIYFKWKGKKFSAFDSRLSDDIFLNDIEELEKAGITHPDFEKVKELLNKTSTNKDYLQKSRR